MMRIRAVQPALVTLVVLVLILAVVLRSSAGSSGPGREIDFTDLSRAASNGQITKATILEADARITGTRCLPRTPTRTPTPGPAPGPAPGAPTPCNGDLPDFHATYPHNDAVTQQLIQNITRNGAPLTIDHQKNKNLTRFFLTILLPLAILANILAVVALTRRRGDRRTTDDHSPVPNSGADPVAAPPRRQHQVKAEARQDTLRRARSSTHSPPAAGALQIRLIAGA